MTRLLKTASFFFLLWRVTMAAAQSPQSQYDPAAQHAIQHKDSLMDFALKWINPSDLDYGQRIEQARRSALAATIYSYGFWSDATAVLLLGAMFIVVLWQRRQRRRIQLST